MVCAGTRAVGSVSDGPLLGGIGPVASLMGVIVHRVVSNLVIRSSILGRQHHLFPHRHPITILADLVNQEDWLMEVIGSGNCSTALQMKSNSLEVEKRRRRWMVDELWKPRDDPESLSTSHFLKEDAFR